MIDNGKQGCYDSVAILGYENREGVSTLARRPKGASVADSFAWKARIIDYMEHEGISQAEMARRIELTAMGLSKLLNDPARQPSVQTVIKSAYAMEEDRWEMMVAAGYPMEGPPPTQAQERVNRILEKEPRLAKVIHDWELQDPLLQESLLRAIEAMVSVRRNGSEPRQLP